MARRRPKTVRCSPCSVSSHTLTHRLVKHSCPTLEPSSTNNPAALKGSAPSLINAAAHARADSPA